MISYDNTHYATLNWLIDPGFWQDDRFLLNLPLCFTGAMAILVPALRMVLHGADGGDAPDDEVGELLIRGPLVFQGYWNNEAETRAAIVNGWLHTGDLAVRDPSGYFRIVDRKKDMIISGGLNVYPAEVESALMDLDGVLECAAYGVPDEKWGEAVAASVVLAPGSRHDQDSIRNDLRARIAAYKIPKHVEFPAALPRTTSGKILRRALRERMARRG